MRKSISMLLNLILIIGLSINSYTFAATWTASEALENFNAILKDNPNNISILIEKAQAELYLGKLDDSINTYTRAITISPTEFLYNDRGLVKYYMHDYKGAFEDFNKAVAINNKFAPAYANRSMIRAEFMKDNKGAIDDCTLAIKYDNKYSDAYYNRANYEDDLKLYDEAINDYKMAIKLNKNNIDAYNNLGNALYKSGDKEQAIKYINTAIKMYQKVGDRDNYENSIRLLNYIKSN